MKQEISHDWEGISLPLITTHDISHGTSSRMFGNIGNYDYFLNNTDFELHVASSIEYDESESKRLLVRCREKRVYLKSRSGNGESGILKDGKIPWKSKCKKRKNSAESLKKFFRYSCLHVMHLITKVRRRWRKLAVFRFLSNPINCVVNQLVWFLKKVF